ncbi:MAG: bifunctional glutamate N-acetyltransferase/amino-acid acetyltransferase ArgJ [Thermoguttaceae bacterium]
MSENSFPLPRKFRFAGVHCGLKSNPEELDLSLVISDRPATAAGVYTQNLVCGAAVLIDRSRTPGRGFRAVVANSRIANDCTGEQGYRDAHEMTALAAEVVGAAPEQALVMSTGVIGLHLPMNKIACGIKDAASQLQSEPTAFSRSARGIMTTDTVEKTSSRSILLSSGEEITIAGFCKGAAMIAPNMRTMLALIMTDAALDPTEAQSLLEKVVDDSFNCISVDGHTSPSDTVLFLANGAARSEILLPEDRPAFVQALKEVAQELAKKIPADGEGASHFITLDVQGCADRESARKLAKKIAEDPLVKTAFYGADPNWGRIISAAGGAGVLFDPMQVGLSINGFELYRKGTPIAFDKVLISNSIRENRDVSVCITFGEGVTNLRFWTTDLTCEYVRLNSDYTT